MPADTPERVRRLLRRGLQKDQKLRLRDMRDARLEIDDVQEHAIEDGRAPKRRSGRRERLAWASALTLVALVAGVLGLRAFRPMPAAPELRLDINTPPTRNATVAVSPDGSSVVVAGTAWQPAGHSSHEQFPRLPLPHQ